MNSRHHRLIGILILLLGLAASYTALAQDIVVISANPESAEQGTNLDVTIAGTGFDNTIEEVKFQPYCPAEPCTDSDDIEVVKFKIRGSKKIIANITVLGDAKLGDFDIAVSRRGGKGTTYFRFYKKFTVKVRPNQTRVSCNVFAPNGTCDCEFNWDQDNNIYTMLEDCHTSETLWLDSQKMWGPHQTNPGTLTAVNCVILDPEISDCKDENGASFEGQFLGSSVIANTNHVAGVRFVDIRFEDPDEHGVGGVTRGCDLENDDIQSAVSFRLHGGIDEEPTKFSFLAIDNTSVDSHIDPLCNAIEVVREPDYTQRYENSRDVKARVEIVVITDYSYVISGIRYEGIRPNGSVNPPIVFGNTIGAPACEGDDPLLDPDTARAIQFGRVLLPDSSDPSSRIAGRVESNTINMATGCGTSGGVGILVVGEPACENLDGTTCTDQNGTPSSAPYQTTVDIVKNDISGAFVGILVDRNVVASNMAGNKLTGVGDTGDIGVCTDIKPKAATSTKGKPNRISGYDDDFFYGGFPDEDYWCLEEASP